MGKSCANERNESSLSNCRVQPALSIKEGLGDFRKNLRFKVTLVCFRKNTSLMVKKSLLVFLKKTKNTIMSRKSKYKCKKCGYATDIYEGRGFMGQHIEAMTCPDCHNIVPLVVGGVIGDAAPSFNSLVGRLCLRCGSDRIHLWDHHTSPRCGGEMQPTGDSEFWT